MWSNSEEPYGISTSSTSASDQSIRLPEPSVSGRSAGTIPQSITQPDELLRHNIADEELTMLSSYSNDPFKEAFWAATGLAAGMLIPTAEAISKAFLSEEAKAVPLSGMDVLQISLCSASAAIAISLVFVIRRNKGKADTLVNEIRSRTRIEAG